MVRGWPPIGTVTSLSSLPSIWLARSPFRKSTVLSMRVCIPAQVVSWSGRLGRSTPATRPAPIEFVGRTSAAPSAVVTIGGLASALHSLRRHRLRQRDKSWRHSAAQQRLPRLPFGRAVQLVEKLHVATGEDAERQPVAIEDAV